MVRAHVINLRLPRCPTVRSASLPGTVVVGTVAFEAARYVMYALPRAESCWSSCLQAALPANLVGV